MRKVVSLSLPSWPTDRLRRQAGEAALPSGEPLITFIRQGQRRIVAAADRTARSLGLYPGLPLTEACARVPDLHVVDADPKGDESALTRLAHWCLRHYSPVVAPDPPDGIWIDATGAGHLFGGDAAMLATITARIMQAGIDARVAMAPTAGAAHALARFGGKPTIIVDATELNAAIGQLPTAALRLSADVLIGLRKLGFERIAQLENTPRAPLALRFGSEIGRRLDQAFGRLSEPLNPIVPLELVRAERAFAEPIAARETIERYIAQLAQRLCEQLEARGLGARRLDLLFRRVDNLIEAVRIGTGKPVRDPVRLTRLLSDQLEKVDPGFGIEQMALIASLTEPLSYRQIVSDGEACRDTDIAALVDTLSNRLGAKRLFRVVPLESDLPERSVKYVPPLAPATGATWPPTLPRPGRLLHPPEPVETMALLPDHPPVQFTWRGMRRRVARADGPERVFGEWWRADNEITAVRDYFQVEDEAGERFWLFRAGDGVDPGTGSLRWFIHGVFA